MAMYTGGMGMKGEKVAAAKRIAEQQVKAVAGEDKRKGRAGIFGKLAGMGIAEFGKKFLLPTLLTTLSGGTINPLTLKFLQALITGGSMFLGRAGAHQATTGKSFLGKILKTPGQVDKIEAGGKYGYGRGEAATLSEALAESTKSKEDWGTLAGDIGGSFASQVTGEKLSDLLKGDYNPFADKIPSAKAGDEILPDVASTSNNWLSNLFQDDREAVDLRGFEGDSRSHMYTYKGDIGLQSPYINQQGGQVPKYYGGGSVSGSSPTIAGYFDGQGKTIGGSNTQSLAEMLGRK